MSVVLAVNPGSSSLKVAVRSAAGADADLSGEVERIGTPEGRFTLEARDGSASDRAFDGDLAHALAVVGNELDERHLTPAVVSHRVVHGGPKHQLPTRIDDDVIQDLKAAVPLAPLHLPGALETIASSRHRWPDAVHVACFDTGFHRDLPEASRRLPVAGELADLGIRRYGFHGLSVQSVLARHPGLGDVVIAHLGSGCSVTAVAADGRPRHTTMSLTPTAGMISGTRSGDLDPEIVLYLIERRGYSPARLRELVDRESGLAGVAGGRHDMRDLLAARDAEAKLAVDMFVRSAAMAIASCATTLDGWDTLVFTGGIGERSERIRDAITARVRVPTEVTTTVIPADEELMLDRLAREVVG